EVKQLRKDYADGRRTVIEGSSDDLDDPSSYIADEEVLISISHEGYIKRVPINAFKRQGRAGVGVSGGELRDGDYVEHLFIASTHDTILVFTDRGRMFWLSVWDIPEMARTHRGKSIRNFLQIGPEERVQAAYAVRDFDVGEIVMATRNG